MEATGREQMREEWAKSGRIKMGRADSREEEEVEATTAAEEGEDMGMISGRGIRRKSGSARGKEGKEKTCNGVDFLSPSRPRDTER